MNRKVEACKRALRERKWTAPVCMLLSFFIIEVYAAYFLCSETLWPLLFGVLWAVLLTGLVWLMPPKGGRILYGIFYFFAFLYSAVQTGYYILFGEMMWLSDFRYASEGSDYLDVLLSYPKKWYAGLFLLLLLGGALLWKFPKTKRNRKGRILAGAAALVAAISAFFLPKVESVLEGGDYKGIATKYVRMESAEAAYENLFNTHRLYQVCGIYQTAARDLYAHEIYPMTPGYVHAQQEAREEIDRYFAQKDIPRENEMTGLLAGKNVVLILMESMDDWMIGEHTPTISRLMEEGIQFTRFYTPGYGGIRTFNTEFCINTGSFLSSQGGYAFDYVTNHFDQSLANALKAEGYSPLTFHYNYEHFYSRGVFSPAMGYEEYVSYQPYRPEDNRDVIYDDQLLFDAPELNSRFFRDGKKLNFIITRSAHLSYYYEARIYSPWKSARC